MEIYLVGGAVRDELLGRPVKERDWVVVGATPEELIARHFQPVGKDFPVFLHPKTHEEYALARTERKTSKGYKGFQFYATPDVTLTEDLKRRDLTINAIAKSKDGKLIDPYHGQKDIQSRWLRHVSPAFAEDPVRILRIARFASSLPEFNVHPDTITLMKNMVNAGEVDALVAERVWKELSRALDTIAPHRFFEVLKNCGAITVLFPELAEYSSDMKTLKKAVAINASGPVRFASTVHCLDIKATQQLCKRYRVPKEYSELALLTAKNLPRYKQLDLKKADNLLDLLRATDAFRRPNRFLDFLTLSEIICDQQEKSQPLKDALAAANKIDIKSLQAQNLKGADFGDAVYKLQCNAIEQLIKKI